jgi:hypothetical protein
VSFYLEGDQNLNFAIPINEVKDLIDRSAKAPPTFLPISGNEPERSQELSTDTIELNFVELHLGMPKEEVLTELSKSADVRSTDASGDSWEIIEKGGQFDKILGTFGFQADKLSWVYKEWGPDDQSKGVEFAGALFAAISQFEKEGRTTCEISAGETQNPKAEIKTAYISCGNKYIDITVIRSTEFGDTASVEENLEKPK